jgi:hypothetical protein
MLREGWRGWYCPRWIKRLRESCDYYVVASPAETQPEVSHFPLKFLVRLHDPIFAAGPL